MEEREQSITILGAGLAGLSCACGLVEKGYRRIHVIEKKPRPGGLATSIRYRGHTIDLGPHRIHSEVDRVHDFLKSRVGGSLITCRRKSRMFLDGRFIAYPPGLKDALSHFGIPRLSGFVAGYARERLSHVFSSPEGENFETVMKCAFGSGLYEAIIRPYTEKTWKRPAASLSVDVAGARVSAGRLGALVKRIFIREKKGRETSLREFLYPRGGIFNLCHALWEQLEKKGVRFSFRTEVSGLSLQPEGDIKILCRKGGEMRSIKSDFCFSTIPLPDLVKCLLPGKSDDTASRAAASLGYLSILLVFVRLSRPRVSDDTWLYFPGSDIVFNRGYEAKSFDPGMGPPDETAICLETTFPLGEKPPGGVPGRTVEDLVKTGLATREEVLDTHTIHLSHAYPIYDIAYRRNVEEIFRYLRSFPRLITLGRQGLFHHNNMDHSIYEGLVASDYFAEKKEACASWYRDADQFRKLRIVD